MLKSLGLLLQVVGFFMVPLAVVGNIMDEKQVSLGTSLTFSAIGIGNFFSVGLQRRGERR